MTDRLPVYMYWEGRRPGYIEVCHEIAAAKCPGFQLLDGPAADAILEEAGFGGIDWPSLVTKSDVLRSVLLTREPCIWLDSDTIVIRDPSEVLWKGMPPGVEVALVGSCNPAASYLDNPVAISFERVKTGILRDAVLTTTKERIAGYKADFSWGYLELGAPIYNALLGDKELRYSIGRIDPKLTAPVSYNNCEIFLVQGPEDAVRRELSKVYDGSGEPCCIQLWNSEFSSIRDMTRSEIMKAPMALSYLLKDHLAINSSLLSPSINDDNDRDTSQQMPVYMYWEGKKPAWIAMCQELAEKECPTLQILDEKIGDQILGDNGFGDIEWPWLAAKCDVLRLLLVRDTPSFYIDMDTLIFRDLNKERLGFFKDHPDLTTALITTPSVKGLTLADGVLMTKVKNAAPVIGAIEAVRSRIKEGDLSWECLGGPAFKAAVECDDSLRGEIGVIDYKHYAPIGWTELGIFNMTGDALSFEAIMLREEMLKCSTISLYNSRMSRYLNHLTKCELLMGGTFLSYLFRILYAKNGILEKSIKSDKQQSYVGYTLDIW